MPERIHDPEVIRDLFAQRVDEQGMLLVESVRPGPIELVTWPPHLATPAAQTEYIREHPYPQWLDVLVRLQPVELAAGQRAADFERRLP